jgi:hypothetical protein
MIIRRNFPRNGYVAALTGASFNSIAQQLVLLEATQARAAMFYLIPYIDKRISPAQSLTLFVRGLNYVVRPTKVTAPIENLQRKTRFFLTQVINQLHLHMENVDYEG